MTDREKMVEAINSVQAYGIMSNAFGGDLPVTNEMLADALIAAGIGDVTEWKHRAAVAERALRKACEHIDGVAETCAVCAKLADKLKAGEVCDRAENCVDNAIKFLTRQAEREIEEEKGE